MQTPNSRTAEAPNRQYTPTRRTASTERFAELSRYKPSTVRPVSTPRTAQIVGLKDNQAIIEAHTPENSHGFDMPRQRRPIKRRRTAAGKQQGRKQQNWQSAQISTPLGSPLGNSMNGHMKSQLSSPFVSTQNKTLLKMSKRQSRTIFGKRRALATFMFLLLTFGGLITADFVMNDGLVHWGVKVEGIDIGGLSQADATAKLQTALDARLRSTTVKVRPDHSSEERLATKGVPLSAQTGTGSSAGTSTANFQLENPEITGVSVSWNFTAKELGASIDAAALVEEAMRVGEVKGLWNFLPALAARIKSFTGGVDIPATVSFDEKKLAEAIKPINDMIGVTMVNSNLYLDESGLAFVTSGRVGIKVDEHAFTARAQEVLLAKQTQPITAPMRNVPLDITDQDAQRVANQVNIMLSDPVTLEYEDSTWSLDAATLGSWIKTSVIGEGSAKALVATIDPVKAYEGLQEIMGEAGYGSAQNAQIDVSSG
ncbi:MAG: peptidoglycan binding domain-containing protein, partial [Eggerthellaceae bacterium]|nr:peptidoglycan binding domain-containing protein [Eggerthellaceae bacterium]